MRQSGEVLVFQHVAQAGEDGRWALTLSGVADAAGNALAPQEVATLVLDGTAPELAGYTQSAAKLNGKDTLVVEFSASETLREPPVVKLGNLAMAREGTGEAPYRFSLPLAGTAMLGSYGVQVAMTDLAGNAALLDPGLAEVDAVPPGLIDAQFSPPVARLGITAYLTVTVSELLSSPPVLAWDSSGGDPGFAFATRSGQAYIYALAVTAERRRGRLPPRQRRPDRRRRQRRHGRHPGHRHRRRLHRRQHPAQGHRAAGERGRATAPSRASTSWSPPSRSPRRCRPGRDRGPGRRATPRAASRRPAATAAPTPPRATSPRGRP